MISRASMKQQMKGNRMKKKPVQKKSIGKMLETFSPAYSIMKGKGPISKLASSGLGGIALKPFAKKQRDKAKKTRMEMAAANKMSSSAVPQTNSCLLYTSPSPRDGLLSRMPSSA